MRNGILGCALLALLGVGPAFAAERQVLDFNAGWRFLKADPPGAQSASFDDSGWHRVSTPHTYNDTDTFDDWSLPGHRGEGNQFGGRTWYRKTFRLPDALRGRRVYVEFEAARQVAEVYLNGALLGTSKTGFTPFGFDLTPHLRFDAPNVLAVMCDNRFMKDPARRPEAAGESRNAGAAAPASGAADLNLAPQASPSLERMLRQMSQDVPEEIADLRADQIPWNNPHWHPAHGGLYRNVWLHVTDPLHVSLPLYSFLGTVGPYVYTKQVDANGATLGLEVPIENGRGSAAEVEVVAEVVDHRERAVLTLKQATRLAAGTSTSLDLSGTLNDPQLWEPDYPYLYRVRGRLLSGGETVDSFELPLGIRTVRWDKDSGFYINGHHLKLHGWGQKPTDEWPGLGAAQPDWMHFFTLELMRKAGGNFVRWGHCAGGPASIEASDRLGLIVDQPGVDGEKDAERAAWKLRAEAFRDTIVYFRNHPSIVIWEGGNQKVTREHARELRGYMDRYDPHGGRAYAHRRADQVTAEFMDVGIGTEGGREIAELPVVEGEYDREESPRRVWDDSSPPNFGYPEAEGQTYQLTSEQYAVNQVRHYLAKISAPDHSGGANWIFSDSTSGGRVAVEVARASGEVDGVRLPKEAYYVCGVLFQSQPQVHIVGHWTYPAGTRKTVYVVSNADEVELLVNGRSLGKGAVSGRYVFSFPDVAWEPGEIGAVAYARGREVARQAKHSAGPALALRLTPITGPGGLRADGADVALFDVEAVDAEGRRCPTFERRVDFELEGPGVWRGGYDSGQIRSVNNAYLDLEAGINRVAVRATDQPGTLVVHATSAGLEPGRASLEAVAVTTGSDARVQRRLPQVTLPDERPTGTGKAVQRPSAGPAASPAGRVVRRFSYSGPTAGVRVVSRASADARPYVDREEAFGSLPPALRGSDYVQAAAADARYEAVDLIEIAVPGGHSVWVAHDDGLPRPAWLTRQFHPTPLSLVVAGRRMTLFERRLSADEGLTLGSNTDAGGTGPGNMYLVFAGPTGR